MMLRHHAKRTGKAILVLATLFGPGSRDSSGAPFRLSFLDERSALADTCQLLKQRGFSDDSVASFQKLVEHHNRHGNRVDRTRFPPPRDGFYDFNELGDFTNGLRTPFSLTPTDHSLAQDTLLCYDVACLLLHGAGYGAPDFEKDLMSRGIVFSEAGPTAFRSAYSSVMFPGQGYKRLVGKPRSEAETQLILSITATRGVTAADPLSEEAWRSAFATWVRGLKEGGFIFPREFKLGMRFFVQPKLRYLWTNHAFFCFPENGRLICLEKNGSPGPYVRAEFKSEEDLAAYMRWAMLEDRKNPKLPIYGSPVLISLNDQLIGVYP